ncbi:hypothetical protein HanIR_Chr02g0055571 [Helianthus annuus]|nr:hypothetical protein HanIR_Chr02g0055571 [Helianthus annuus]
MQSQREAIVRLSGENQNLLRKLIRRALRLRRKRKNTLNESISWRSSYSGKRQSVRLPSAFSMRRRLSGKLLNFLLRRPLPIANGYFLALADRILNSTELATYMFELGQAAYNSGRKCGYAEGKAAVINKEKDYHFELYKEDCDGAYAAKRKEFSTLEFVVVRAAEKLARKPDGVALLKKALGDDGGAAGGAGTSQT